MVNIQIERVSLFVVWVIDAHYVKDYQIWLRFNDQTEKIIDLKAKVMADERAIFKPLREVSYFRRVFFNPESDTIEWPNGVDMAPETLYRLAGEYLAVEKCGD